MPERQFVPYSAPDFTEEKMLERSREFYEFMDQRRSVREFSTRPVDREVINNLIKTASTAPSGAHKQPWTFCVLTNQELRRELRQRAEEEEKRSYEGRMSEEWLDDLEPLGTNHIKPFLEEAPYIVVVFKRLYEYNDDGSKHPNYYVNESVGIAVGLFLAALHNAGLCGLTHTPSPMNFLAQLLERPENERPYVLIPVGHPADNAKVPNLERKPLDAVSAYYD